MLECNLDVKKAQGELIFELSKSVYRYQARFNLVDGVCTLVRIADGKEEKLDSKATRVKGPGAYMVRFANIDARLTVWVDRELPFDEGFTYSPPEVWAAGEKDKVERRPRTKPSSRSFSRTAADRRKTISSRPASAARAPPSRSSICGSGATPITRPTPRGRTPSCRRTPGPIRVAGSR